MTATEKSIEYRFEMRRILNWLPLGLMYAAFYMSRYNFTVTNPALCREYGWTNTDVGIIITAATMTYGLAVLFNGPLADRIGGKKAILIGCVGSLIFNLIFSLGEYFRIFGWDTAPWSRLIWFFAIVWAANHYFQSFGALSVVKVNAAWFHMSERGIFSGLFGAMIQFGRILAVPVGGVILATSGWVWVHIVPAIVLAAVGILTILFVRDTPEELGFPRQDDKLSVEGEEKAPPTSEIIKTIFTNPTLWIIAGAMVCTGIIRHSIEQWSPKYFENVFAVKTDSMLFILAFAGQVMLGIFGAFVLGNISDRYFQSRRGPVTAIAYFSMGILLFIFYLLKPGAWLSAILLMIVYFFLNGCHGLIAGTASMDFGGRKAAATAAGFLDGSQYLIGGALSGVGVGQLIDRFGWSIWTISIIPFAIVAGILMATRWNALPQQAKKDDTVICGCGATNPGRAESCLSCGKPNLDVLLKSIGLKAKEAFNTGIFSLLMLLFPVVILASKLLGGIFKPESSNPFVNSVLVCAILSIGMGLLARSRIQKAKTSIEAGNLGLQFKELIGPATTMSIISLAGGLAATVYGLFWLLKGLGAL